MDKSSAAVCTAFLHTLLPKQQRALLKHLPANEDRQFSQAQHFFGDATSEMPAPEEELSHVHFSWFAPFLRSLPESDIKLFLGSLTEDQQKGLKGTLLFSNQIPALSEVGKLYLKRQLFSSLIGQEDLLPLCCLLNTPITALLSMDHEELLDLIDLLSMHDLASEIRQIIDTSKLKRIYAILSPAQINFLKTLIYRKEPVVFKKLELTKWDGRTEVLKSTLEQRGINRLAKALNSEQPSLLWYIAHRLDIDKGQQLIKLCTPLDHPQAALLLSEQVVHLIHALKNPT
ncbi:MAG TPA: hypothetical protein VGJ00_09240 [Rhabdochlamydiaceae bacterium]|jgi:hypothetical protein